MATSVELHLGEVAAQAGHGVRAHGLGVAARDGLGGAEFARVQMAAPGKSLETLLEDLLK